MTKLSTIWQSFLNLLFPPQCISCQVASEYFCADCQAQVSYLKPPICKICGYPKTDSQAKFCRQCQTHSLKFIDGIRSVAGYNDSPLKIAIHKFKYQNKQALSKTLAKLLAKSYVDYEINTTTIVPVPLHKSRYKERGFNQSALLAQELAKLINQPVDTKTLIRHQKTATQMTLKASERTNNVAQAFSYTSDKLAGQAVLLIDDVCTTGSTLDACAKTLKEAQVMSVYGLTLARAL